jgi:3-oxoadipate enol-lactonase
MGDSQALGQVDQHDDRRNIPAAREIAALPHAELRIVPRVGHPWNRQEPELFSRTIAEFYARLSSG